MMFTCQNWRAICLMLSIIVACHFCRAETEPVDATEVEPFSIVFLRSKVAFAGSIDSKTTADALAAAVLSARPGLNIVNTGMEFVPEVKVPNLRLMKSLLVEIALSTHEGVFEISDKHILVGGLTDSVVTSSVLRLRTKPILEGRQYQEQLCLVPSEDLPEIPVLLSTGETRKAFSFNLELEEKAIVSFEPPGIMISKLLSLIEGSGEWVATIPDVTVTQQYTQPANTARALTAIPSESSPEVTIDTPAQPNPYEEFGPLLFVRNSFLLQSGQKEVVGQIADLIQLEPWTNKPILVRSITYRSGSEAFANWVSERRLAEAVRQLKEAGIEENLIKPEAIKTTNSIDKGEVQVLILKPEATVE